ncbi:MAG TPA: hypothetical protein VGY98_06385, partial [Verrucomicrobiae bacterium]|nr:hypothetical protein [Verrucomicrobiae bacterium]
CFFGLVPLATNVAGPWSKWNLFGPEGSETFDSQTMMERLAEPTLPARCINLTPRLVVRESCGAYLPRANQAASRRIGDQQ